MSSSSEPKPPRLTEMLCSHCQKSVVFDLSRMPAHFPFCSMRCKALDLGMWLEPEEDEDEAEGGEAQGVVAGDFSDDDDPEDEDSYEEEPEDPEEIDGKDRPGWDR